jgi:hypothetical protein
VIAVHWDKSSGFVILRQRRELLVVKIIQSVCYDGCESRFA